LLIFFTSVAPEPLKLGGDSRVRFNSLDSGALLKSATTVEPLVGHASDPEPEVAFSRTEAPAEDFAPPAASTSTHHSQRSIALRAIRSVRSLARIGSWAQLRNQEDNEGAKEAELKDSSKSETQRKEKKSKKEKKEKKERKKKEKKEKETEEKEKTMTATVETGRASPSTMKSTSSGSQTLSRKVSILGLGLPSSIRLPKLRGGSTASSVV